VRLPKPSRSRPAGSCTSRRDRALD
jgi:hypothetical protein